MLRTVSKVSTQSKHMISADQRIHIGLAYPVRLIISQPVLEVMNCLKEGQKRVYCAVSTTLSSGIHGTYIIEATLNPRPL